MVKNTFLFKICMAQNFVKDISHLEQERNSLENKLNTSENTMDDLFAIVDEIRGWIEEIKHDFFHLHTSNYVDKEFSAIYEAYFFSDKSLDFDELLATENFQELRNALIEVLGGVNKFFQKIEINPEYNNTNSIPKYRYKEGFSYKEHLTL